jgi:hypothetical protein
VITLASALRRALAMGGLGPKCGHPSEATDGSMVQPPSGHLHPPKAGSAQEAAAIEDSPHDLTRLGASA